VGAGPCVHVSVVTLYTSDVRIPTDCDLYENGIITCKLRKRLLSDVEMEEQTFIDSH
jgi:hypothetical protein